MNTMRQYASLIAGLTMISAGLSACTTAALPGDRTISPVFEIRDDRPLAPFGGDVTGAISNYTRAAPYVGTAGRLTQTGVAQAKSLGFNLIIDVRQPDETGVSEEIAIAEAIGIPYRNIPLAPDQRAWRQVEQIQALLTDPENFPVLLHCGSANRVGAVWALLRSREGVDPITAIEEGRAIGLTSREPMVRQLLGMTNG